MKIDQSSCASLENLMGCKEPIDKVSVYVPQAKLEERPVERLIALAEKRDRSVNYLVIEAILQYLVREELVAKPRIRVQWS